MTVDRRHVDFLIYIAVFIFLNLWTKFHKISQSVFKSSFSLWAW